MSSSKEPNGVTRSGGTRREFLKILGATTATTAAIGCSSDRVERLIPYLNHPDETVPGVSTYYATTCRECAVACGVIAETRDGRAIKLEGNPAHPLNRGALCARGQAALQGLYNPDRYRGPMLRRNDRLEPVTWDQALQTLAQKLGEVQSSGRAGDAVFINGSETGSFPAFVDQWLSGFGIPAHLSYDALADVSAVAANRHSYGVSWPALRFSEAKLIVSVGADFLDAWGAPVPQQLDFADARAKIEGAPRFVYIGARRSLTGLNADEWIPCKPGSELAIVNALGGAAGASLDQAAQVAGVPVATLERLGREWAATKPSLMLSGVTTGNAMAVALAVNALNQSAGNVGLTIRPSEGISAFDTLSSPAEIAEALTRMGEGRVPLLMVRNANPLFTLPKSGRFAEAIAKVAFKVSFSSYPDETSELCDLVLPDHHPLESWGDAQATANVMSLQQPAMDPVFSTRATADVLIALAKGNQTTAAQYPAPDYRSWLIGQFPGGPSGFAKALETAVIDAQAPAPRPLRELAPITAAAPLEGQGGDFFLVVYPSAVLGDRGANKPWLQELPDPVSKICWQSWVEIHPTTAARLDVDPGELLTLESPTGVKLTVPAYVYPGIRQDTVGMVFGQGHRASRAGPGALAYRGYPEGTVLEGYGRYARGVGVNPLDLLLPAFEPNSGALAWTSIKVKVSKEGGYQQLVTTEGSARQHGRGIGRALVLTSTGLRDADASEYEATPPATAGEPPATHGAEAGTEAGAHHFPGDASHEFLPGLRAPVAQDAEGALADKEANDKGMYDPAHSSGMTNRRWAMTVDLARCTGCSA
ncbi:MAG: molybdopterin-dependent oxidoreductase, partial [Gemmatimonadaceae bacterium]